MTSRGARTAEHATPEALIASADGLLQQGRIEAAIEALDAALALRPQSAPALFLRAQASWMQGDLAAAAEKLREGLALMPQAAEAHNNLGLVYKSLGRYDEAIASFRRALGIVPNVAWLHCNLGNALQAQGRVDAAIDSYSRALAVDPRHAESHFNLGNVLKDRGDVHGAVASYREAVSLQPGNSVGHIGLGSALQLLGELDDALASFRRALTIDPENVDARSGLLFTMNIHPGVSKGERLSEARRYGDGLDRRVRPFTHWDIEPGRPIGRGAPLRVGLVSGDLRLHPVGFFVESVLDHIDPARVQFVAYPTLPLEDELSARIKPRFAAWTSIAALDDGAAARTIRAGGVQILLDLSGHTAHNRLPVFAWKPAPVQASWLGYFATTGVAAIDYVIADPVSVPDSVGDQFTEAVWRLPDGRFCFTPPGEAARLDPGPLPALRSGHVTFGCFQNVLKMNDAVLAAWGRIFQALPRARLRVQNGAMAFETARAKLLQRLHRAGIGQDRVTLVGPMPRDAYLAAHAEVDLILDTFPYTGATTTCEALWMGVPTLTLAGDTLVSRQGASLLASAGLNGWVTEDEAAYVARAVDFASGFERLARLRSGLRETVLSSPLFDARRFALNLENALQAMWQRKMGGGTS